MDNIRYAGKINREAINYGFTLAKPGISLKEIDRNIEDFILKNNCKPAFKNYHPAGYPIPFPSTACISVNDIAVHGIPNDYLLKEGDMITIDLGTEYNGWFADAADTRIIGENHRASKLLKATQAILDAQLNIIKANCNFLTLTKIADQVASQYDYYILPQLGGHRIGRCIHIPPFVPNTINKHSSPIQQEIMKQRYEREIFIENDYYCIEPVVTSMGATIFTDADQWTVRTPNKELVCHLEKMILITKEGYELIS